MAKRRRRPVVRQTMPAQPKQETDSSPVRNTALDAFLNQTAFLGTASELTKANDYERNSISRDYEKLTVLYRENWIAKRIIDTPCEDMTRAWYSIDSGIDQDRIDELARLEAKHNIKQEITNGLRWARLYGGAAAVIVIKGQEDMLDQPLDFDELLPGCFRGLIIVDRSNGLAPSVELEEDMDDPEFGYPRYYDVTIDNNVGSTVRIHHSRLIPFRGRMLPIREEINEEYWGASELEHIYEELQKRDATSANIAQLIFQANITALKISDYGETMTMGTEKQKDAIMNAIYNMNRLKNSFGLYLMGSDDSYEQHPYSFSGLAEVYESFMMDMAGAAEIPATKLYGRSPQGMNATGESDMKNYYEMLAQLQERSLRPAIEKLMPIMCMSLWGEVPEDINIVFEPLMVTTPAERAQIMQQVTGVVVQAYSAGLITQRAALEELRRHGKEASVWGSITDELVDKADDEFESGEDMEDPMGMMGAEGGEEGGMPGMPPMPGAPEGEPEPPQGGPEKPPEGPNGPPEPGKGEEPATKPEAPKQAAEKPEGQPVKQPEPEQKEEPKPMPKQEAQKPAPKEQTEKDDFSEFKARILEAAQNGEFDKARQAIAEYKAAREQPKPKKGVLRTLFDVLRGRFGRDWREEEHPRDKSGKFTSGGGSKGSGKSDEGKPTEAKPPKAESPVDFTKLQAPKSENNLHEGVYNSPQAEYNPSGSAGTASGGAANASFAKTAAKKFRETFHAAKAAIAKDHPEQSWRVDSSYTDADYEHMDCYTTKGGSAVAVHDGDIVSVCHMPGDTVRGSELLKHALENGGKKLDAYAGLYGFYAKNGFEPVSWCEFDEQYAPPDWVKGRDEAEPVIFWKHTGRSYEEITEKYGRTHRDFTKRVRASEDYGAAQAVRDRSMEG